MYKKYAKTTEEKRELTERLYELRKKKMRADIDYKVAMDEMSLRSEIKALEKLMNSYNKGTQARKELELQEYDLKVYYGQLTLQQQEAYLKKLVQSYKKGTQERIDLEKQLHDVQQQIRDQNITKIDNLFNGVVSALKARYVKRSKSL